MEKLLYYFIENYFLHTRLVPIGISSKLQEVTKFKHNITCNTIDNTHTIFNVENVCNIEFITDTRNIITKIEIM